MKTQGEIEAASCEGISRFEQEYMGRGPKKTQAHLLRDLLVVRLQGLLTTAEQQLAKTPATKCAMCDHELCQNCGGELRTAIFCPTCGRWVCCCGCLDAHLIRHSPLAMPVPLVESSSQGQVELRTH